MGVIVENFRAPNGSARGAQPARELAQTSLADEHARPGPPRRPHVGSSSGGAATFVDGASRASPSSSNDGPPLAVGQVIRTLFKVGGKERWFQGEVTAVYDDGLYDVQYSDGDCYERMSRKKLVVCDPGEVRDGCCLPRSAVALSRRRTVHLTPAYTPYILAGTLCHAVRCTRSPTSTHVSGRPTCARWMHAPTAARTRRSRTCSKRRVTRR